MKQLWIVIGVALALSMPLQAADIVFYDDLNIAGVIVDSKGVEHHLERITHAYGDWHQGKIKEYIPDPLFTGQYGESTVEVPVETIAKIEFQKEEDWEQKGLIHFYAKVFLRTGEERKLLVFDTYEYDTKRPHRYFTGTSAFGDEIIQLWNIRRIEFGAEDVELKTQ